VRRHSKASPALETSTAEAHRLGRFALTLLAAAVAALMLVGVAPAAAATQKTCAEIGGSNAHCFDGAETPATEELRPARMAVNEETGDVYVINTPADAVDVFSPTGVFIEELRVPVEAGGTFHFENPAFGFDGEFDGIAVDNSSAATKGSVYVVGFEFGSIENRLTAFDKNGAFEWQTHTNVEATAAAVDPSGNLWIGSVSGVQQRSTTDGSPIGPSYGASKEAYDGLAIDSSGNFYFVTLAYGLDPGTTWQRLAPVETSTETEFDSVPAYGVATNWSNNDVFVDHQTSIEQYTSTDTSKGSFGSGPYRGLAVDGSRERAYLANSASNTIEIWSLAEEGPSGPTNLRTLTVTKSAGGTGGIGAVSSKPKGINCGAACDSAVASMYKSTPVTLTAKPSLGSTFVEWTGACSGASTTCTVPMAEDEEVTAVFGGTSKAILNPQALTLSKGESSGKGTIKAAGLACEAECSETTVLYQGPTGVAPKNKPGKTVELKATAVFGSEFSGWSGSGCSGTGTCLVTMEEAKSVTATFTAKPNATLTVDKAGTGTGAISSKPKAINCGFTCTTQDASVPEGEAILLTAKPALGMTFAGWSGGGCSGTGTCTVSLSEATTVTAEFSGSPKAILNPQALTLTKAGSGYGTVKAAGLTCEVLCTSAVSLYQGPTGVAPKNKPGKTVILKAISAPGAKPVQWSGCESNPTPSECSVTMEAAREVTATFDELE
jgi:hypothetical protein